MIDTADRAASVSTYVGLISAVQTLEQTHGKSKLYTTCLAMGDEHSQNHDRYVKEEGLTTVQEKSAEHDCERVATVELMRQSILSFPMMGKGKLEKIGKWRFREFFQFWGNFTSYWWSWSRQCALSWVFVNWVRKNNERETERERERYQVHTTVFVSCLFITFSIFFCIEFYLF